MEPELFAEFWMRAEPFFEIMVGSLPVLPNSGGAIDSTTFSSEIINIKWLQNEFNFAVRFF